MTIYVQYIWDNGEDDGIFSSEEDDFIENNSLWTIDSNTISSNIHRESRIETDDDTLTEVYTDEVSRIYEGRDGTISYQNPFTSFTITLDEFSNIMPMTVKGVSIDLTDIIGSINNNRLVNKTTISVEVRDNGVLVNNETEDTSIFYNGIIDNDAGIVVSFSNDFLTFMYSYFHTENVSYPEIETLWVNDGSTSVAKHSNNYLIGRSWVDGLSFKINTDNIKVESYEQVFNTVNIHVIYQEVENV